MRINSLSPIQVVNSAKNFSPREIAVLLVSLERISLQAKALLDEVKANPSSEMQLQVELVLRRWGAQVLKLGMIPVGEFRVKIPMKEKPEYWTLTATASKIF